MFRVRVPNRKFWIEQLVADFVTTNKTVEGVLDDLRA